MPWEVGGPYPSVSIIQCVQMPVFDQACPEQSCPGVHEPIVSDIQGDRVEAIKMAGWICAAHNREIRELLDALHQSQSQLTAANQQIAALREELQRQLEAENQLGLDVDRLQAELESIKTSHAIDQQNLGDSKDAEYVQLKAELEAARADSRRLDYLQRVLTADGDWPTEQHEDAAQDTWARTKDVRQAIDAPMALLADATKGKASE